MRIYIGMISFGNEIAQCDAIMHEGALWLVPQWLAGEHPNTIRPERIVRIPLHHVQLLVPPTAHGDFVANRPVATLALSGTREEARASGFVVEFDPPLDTVAGRA